MSSRRKAKQRTQFPRGDALCGDVHVDQSVERQSRHSRNTADGREWFIYAPLEGSGPDHAQTVGGRARYRACSPSDVSRTPWPGRPLHRMIAMLSSPDQRPASRRRESSEGRLGPLLSQQPTATISPNPAVHLGGPRLASLVEQHHENFAPHLTRRVDDLGELFTRCTWNISNDCGVSRSNLSDRWQLHPSTPFRR